MTEVQVIEPMMEDQVFSGVAELTNLHAKLLTTQDKFGAWNEALVSEMREWFSKFSHSIGKHEGHLVELKDGLQKLQNHNEDNNNAASESLQTLERAKEFLTSLRDGLHIKLTEKKHIDDQIESETAALESEKEMLTESEAAVKQRSTELSQMSLYVKEILGLSFQKAPGQKMQVIFRNINVNNPDDPFVLSVAIINRNYEVSDCQPAIDDLPQLVDQLNESNNFRSFLLTVRERFQQLL